MELKERHAILTASLFQGGASDIDLAVCGGNITCFALDVNECTSTPLKFDVINMDRKIQRKLQKSIETERIILYEKI